MHFRRFEEMAVWQDARRLTQAIYRATGTLAFRRDFGLRDQIQRAAVSVMSNISEGYERASRKEFLPDLNYAKGSIGELRSKLYVALDLKYVTPEEYDVIQTLSLLISRQLSKFMSYLRQNQNRIRTHR